MSPSLHRPKPTDSLKGRDTGDEFLFYDPERDVVHVLNGTAREIYLFCDGTRTGDQIAAALAERYGLDEATARADTQQTLDRLNELGLLTGES